MRKQWRHLAGLERPGVHTKRCGWKETAEKRPRRVLLVERHVLMRRAATEWINQSEGLTVCGAVSDMRRALMAVKRLHPDIVVTEVLRSDDLQCIHQLRRLFAQLPILVFTLEGDEFFKTRAFEAGASGYLMKQAGGELLVQSIRALVKSSGHSGRGVRLRVWGDSEPASRAA